MYINGGNFWTEGTTLVPIYADVTFNAGTINLNHFDQTNDGSLSVSGNVTIGGSARWDCKVDCTAGSTKADYIQSRKLLTLGGNSTLRLQAINLPPNGTVPLGVSWLFISDNPGTAIAGGFENVIAAFNDGSGKSWTSGTNRDGSAGYLKS